jgi:hypothetical protein
MSSQGSMRPGEADALPTQASSTNGGTPAARRGYVGSALLSAASAITTITPHLAGAVDIMAVVQPDGSLLSTPFYGEQACWADHPWIRPCTHARHHAKT